MLRPRQSGSRGTDTSRWRRATRAISASVASGSGTCSSTSIAQAMSNSSSPNDSRVASSARNSRFGRAALLPLGAQLGVVEVDADDAAVAEPLGPLDGEHALAAAHVEHGLGRGALPELVERRVEAGHQALDDRVGGAVLVEGVAGGDLGARRRARRSQLERLPLLRLAGGPARAGRRWWAPGRSRTRRARSARAPRRGAAPRAARARGCAAGARGCRRGCRRARRARRTARPR